jgi:tRNA 2-thiouridine synthesizing protein A
MEHVQIDDALYLDLCGLRCPQPVLRTRKAMRRLAPGTILRVECTDPLAAIDLPNLVRQAGFDLLAVERLATSIVFRIRRPAMPT